MFTMSTSRLCLQLAAHANTSRVTLKSFVRCLGTSSVHETRLPASVRTVTSTRDISNNNNNINNNNINKPWYNVGVMGAGRISSMHMHNVLKNRRLDLKWVVEDQQTACDVMRKDFRLEDTPFHSSRELSRLLADDSLDAVLIFTSTPSHTDLSCQALNNGKAVFVEKPAGESVEDIRRCYDTAQRVGRPFLTGYNRRFDPTMSEAHRQVASGAVGKLQLLRFTTRDSPKPSYDFLKSADTTGCNILADLCVHDVDQLVWITKAERPESIYVTTHAHDAVMAEFKEADAIGVMMKYPSGVIVNMDAFRESVYGYDIRMEIFGSEGCVMANNPRETSVATDTATGARENRLHYSFPQRFGESFMAELDHFVDCLDGTATPLVTKEESLLVAEIVDKGLESFRTKAPVLF